MAGIYNINYDDEDDNDNNNKNRNISVNLKYRVGFRQGIFVTHGHGLAAIQEESLVSR